MTIDGPAWFAAALIICALHTLWLIEWRAEARQRIAEWRDYDKKSQGRHDEFMAALRQAREHHDSLSN